MHATHKVREPQALLGPVLGNQIFKKLIHNQLQRHFNMNNLLDKKQLMFTRLTTNILEEGRV